MLQGSVGKTYFAALAMQLMGEGRLDLTVPASRYLGHNEWYPRIPNATAVTVRHLMTHTSGVMRYEFKEAFTMDLTAQPGGTAVSSPDTSPRWPISPNWTWRWPSR